MTIACRRIASLTVLAFLVLPLTAVAQDSKSAALATELARLLDEKKIDTIAAKVTAPDQYTAAMYFPGTQLLVVGAKYVVPDRMDEALKEKKFRDVYIDLNSASVPQSKIFISDLGANGLQARRRGSQPADSVDTKGKSYTLDGDWGKAKISEDEYMKTFQESDSEYAKMLAALIAELKR
jgi:hypothetical protein